MSVPCIREHFKPAQPAFALGGEPVCYRESSPAEALSSLVYCYWELKTEVLLDAPYVYRVVADGCIDIFFSVGKPDESFLMGFCRRFTEFPLGCSFHYAGIRFLPTAFPAVFGVDASTLSNRWQALEDVLPQTALWLLGHVRPDQGLDQLGPLIDEHLAGSLIPSGVYLDPRFLEALCLLLRQRGMISLGSDLNTGLSPRQLRRYFAYYIGASAKLFSQVLRFQHVLLATHSWSSLREDKVFLDLGYFDQSHFIKAFKTFYGVTPSRAFGR
jgi:AraC-like DNA-binding protein